MSSLEESVVRNAEISLFVNALALRIIEMKSDPAALQAFADDLIARKDVVIKDYVHLPFVEHGPDGYPINARQP